MWFSTYREEIFKAIINSRGERELKASKVSNTSLKLVKMSTLVDYTKLVYIILKATSKNGNLYKEIY